MTIFIKRHFYEKRVSQVKALFDIFYHILI